MSRRSALPLALFLALLAGASARADDRVPAIPDSALPAVGTCAPLDTENVSIVRPGPRNDLRWFAVSGVRDPVDYRGLVNVLRSRAGSRHPSPHAVWITASSQHAWMHVLVILKAAYEAGLYRVGVRVRSETTGQVQGFPLFVPAARSGQPGPKAGRLDVKVRALTPHEAKAPSDLDHIYAAARRAYERRKEFGVSRIVAHLWLSPNLPLQVALSAIDLLYRGGCAGVIVAMSLRSNRRGLNVVPIVEIQGGVASRHPQSLKPPPVQPRSRPWGVDGANEHGWVDFTLEELPSLGTPGDGSPSARPAPRPNYAAEPNGVPADVWRNVDWGARKWAYGLGQDLQRILTAPDALSREELARFTVSQRRPQAQRELLAPARKLFPDATRVLPYALQVSAFLFHGGKLHGRADITLCLGGDRVRVLFASWRPLDPRQPLTLVPFEVDPFAAGEASLLRVWVEGLLHRVKVGGTDAIPLAEPAHVLPYLPAVAQMPTTRALTQRSAALQGFAAGVARTPCDRVVLALQRMTASVIAGRKVVGRLDLRLSAEETDLRIATLSGQRAP
jgi:hypothetical protein